MRQELELKWKDKENGRCEERKQQETQGSERMRGDRTSCEKIGEEEKGKEETRELR